MTITRIASHPNYTDTGLIVRDIVRLANTIKRNISRLIVLKHGESSPKTDELIERCKQRIVQKLETVSLIRKKKKIENDEIWNNILVGSLSQVYKHSDDPEFRQKLQSLISVDMYDTSKTGIYFLQMYMKLVGRIPENQIHLPFKP